MTRDCTTVNYCRHNLNHNIVSYVDKAANCYSFFYSCKSSSRSSINICKVFYSYIWFNFDTTNWFTYILFMFIFLINIKTCSPNYAIISNMSSWFDYCIFVNTTIFSNMDIATNLYIIINKWCRIIERCFIYFSTYSFKFVIFNNKIIQFKISFIRTWCIKERYFFVFFILILKIII